MPTVDLNQTYSSSVYGPVNSWRVGSSLGVDLLLQTSICSFNCIYCQLGDIQKKTIERKIYVPTEQVEKDFKNSRWQEADIVTFSGSGEPTLALNLAEVVHFIKEYSGKPVMVLTNATTLNDPAVINDLQDVDHVACKLDAASEEKLKMMNRPVDGVTFEGIVSGIKNLRQNYKGKLSLQCMFMPGNLAETEALCDVIKEIKPDEVQLNTPKRAYPLEWHLESRGNHGKKEYPTRELRMISEVEADEIELLIAEKTGVPILSFYQKH